MSSAVLRGIGVALGLLGACCMCAADKVMGVVVMGKPLTEGPAPTVVNGMIYGPVAPCALLTGATAQWDPEAQTLTISRPDIPSVVLRVGETQLRVGDRPEPLSGAMRVVEGRCYGPLGPVMEALGCRLHFDPEEGYAVASGLITGLQVRADGEGALLRVQTSAPAEASPIGALSDPPRRYIDFRGFELDMGLERCRYVYTGGLAKARLGEPSTHPAISRVALDIVPDIDVTWRRAENGCGGMLTVGKPGSSPPVVERNLAKLTDVVMLQPRPGAETLRALTDWQIEPYWDVAIRPPRITLVFPDVACAMPVRDLPMFGEFVDTVRVVCCDDPPSTTVELMVRELIKFDVRQIPSGGAEVVFEREKLGSRKVVLDAGHGGRDRGASGTVLLEKQVNLDVAQRAATLLRRRGVRTWLTRADDTYTDLLDRAEMANRLSADMFVSIHCNAMPGRNQGHGTETFYYRPVSKCLGLVMQNSLVAGLGRKDRGLKRARFAVIRHTRMPAVLVELMFLNSDEEEALLQQDVVRQRAAGAIVEGLRQFVEGTGSPSTKVEGRAGLRRAPGALQAR